MEFALDKRRKLRRLKLETRHESLPRTRASMRERERWLVVIGVAGVPRRRDTLAPAVRRSHNNRSTVQ